MTAQKRISALVFDTNIFLTGIDFTLFPNTIYTTSKVLEEINVPKFREKNRNILNRISAAIDAGKLIIEKPEINYIKSVIEKSKNTGDFKAISEVDIELIALGLQIEDKLSQDVIIYTNDYSMENVCIELDLKFKTAYRNGIKKKWQFEVYCPVCDTKHKPERLYSICDRCGTKLKRKPITK